MWTCKHIFSTTAISASWNPVPSLSSMAVEVGNPMDVCPNTVLTSRLCDLEWIV